MKRIRKHLAPILLGFLLAIGVWHPLWECVRECVYDSAYRHFVSRGAIAHLNDGESMEPYANRKDTTDEAMTYNYFTYDIEGDFFYQHIARTRLP